MKGEPLPFSARELYERYRAAIAYIVVRDKSGSEGIGSAFHVGDGVFVTARHVVEGKTIGEIRTFARTYIRLEGEAAEKSLTSVVLGEEKFKVHYVEATDLVIERGPFYHPDAEIDVAVFKVREIDPYTPSIPLGDHLDDWLGQDDFVLTEIVVLGFPPLPFAHGPHLMAARGEVNALVDLRHAKHVHFIVSTMPRGGFSGGVVLTQGGEALGVVTQSLVVDNQPEQLGYMAVLTVEPIYNCLAVNRLMPQALAKQWEDFWNLKSINFVEKDKDGRGELVVASIDSCDDGLQLYIEVRSKKSEQDRDQALSAAIDALEGFATTRTNVDRDGIRITIELRDEARDALVRACAASAEVFAQLGYLRGWP